MKSLLLSAVVIAVSMLSCAKDKCGAGSIDGVEPGGNPAGYQIRVTGSGFAVDSRVRFDDKYGIVQFKSAKELFVTVPSGLVGNVTVVAESADSMCVGRSDQLFEVFGTFPSGIPASPSFIVVPVAPVAYPDGFTNEWPNLFDSSHKLILVDNGTGILDNSGSTEIHDSKELFQNNPITGHFRLNAAAKTSDIEITINRSDHSGGTKETYKGELVSGGSVGSSKTVVLLLTSKKDGRQLLFEYPG